MKKHLSLILMALVAGAMMFTSCGKEQYTITVGVNDASMGSATGGGKYDVNTEVTLTATPNTGYDFVKWSDGNTDNPRTVVVTADAEYTAIFQRHVVNGATISFQGSTWTAANLIGYDYSSDGGYITFYMFRTANDQSDIYVHGYLQSTPGTYDYESSGHDIFYLCTPDQTYYDADGLLSNDGSTGTYYLYAASPSTFTETISAIDLNNKVISGSWYEDMFNLEDYVAAGLTTPSNLYPLSCQMVNATWVWGQSSKNAQKVKDSKFLAVR
ncbi:MAG: hypothetical protein J6T13_00810 [Bacteroidales bacterium]|nr:hypothetical protein [Bacteroidales bacterium]